MLDMQMAVFVVSFQRGVLTVSPKHRDPLPHIRKYSQIRYIQKGPRKSEIAPEVYLPVTGSSIEVSLTYLAFGGKME